VSGASQYIVAIRGDNFYWWSAVNPSTKSHEVATEMVYPETAPELAANVDYKLIVQTRGGSSSDEPGPGLGFSILASKDRKVVEKEQRKIEELRLPKGPTDFLIAYIYATHGLNAEGIQRLESIPPTFKAAAVARLLGDLYLNVGLTRQAEDSYLKSLNLSKDENDEEGEMLAHFNLAHIYAQVLGNRDSAREHFDAVLALAEKIGDHLTASQAATQLAELKRATVP
jgi:tetratricopeptide (TPR) repeat protein